MAEAAPPPAPAGFDIRRILLLAGVGLVIIIAIFFFSLRGCGRAVSGPSGYLTIYSNLDLKDSANVVARLKELNIPYELREEGRSIAVPKDKADQARLGLAEENLPAGGVVGWEIFDESRLGATDFDRRIQLIRAISGELSRTIRRIQAVDDARVQIVLPETGLFAETVAPVTASVMLRLKPGAELTRGKVNGIIHLVASSVENLQPENVTVVDSTGRILTAKGKLPTELVREEQVVVAAERPVEEKITVLEEIKKEVKLPVTPEAAVKTVEAAPVKEAEEKKVEPPKVLTKEEKILLMVKAKNELERDLAGKAQEILNRFYPPNSAIVKVDVEIFNNNKGLKFAADQLKIKKTTAIILVDNRVDVNQNLKSATFKSVAAAIGYDRKRGDRIVLQKVPFHLATPPPEVVKGEVEKALPVKRETKLPVLPATWIRNIIWLLAIMAGLFVLVFIRRLFKRGRREEEETIVREERPAARAAPSLSREKMTAIESIRSAVDRNPERVAELLRDWLTE